MSTDIRFSKKISQPFSGNDKVWISWGSIGLKYHTPHRKRQAPGEEISSSTEKIKNLHGAICHSPRGREIIPPKFHLIPPKFHFVPTWKMFFLHVEISKFLPAESTIVKITNQQRWRRIWRQLHNSSPNADYLHLAPHCSPTPCISRDEDQHVAVIAI